MTGGPSPAKLPVAAGLAGLAGSAALIAGVTIASRAAGFGRTLAFSGAVGGQGCLGTAYATANRLPNVLFEVAAGGALAGAVVPVLAARLAAGDREDADRAASALLTWTVVLLTPLSVLLALLAGPLTTLLLGSGGGTCSWTATDAARMLLLFAPQVVLYGVGIVLTGVLQAHGRFGWPAAAPLLSSLTVVAAYLTFGALAGSAKGNPAFRPDTGELVVLAGGTTLGVVALSLPLLVPVLRSGTRLRPTLTFPAGAATQVRVLALAGVGALLAQQAAVVVTVVLANRVGGRGAFTVVEFAQAVYLLPYAVLAVPVATAAFPRLSAQAARGDRAGYAATVAATTRVVVLAGLAGTALLVAAAPAVEALFLSLDAVGGGVLPDLGATLTAFAPGLVGWALVAHLGRALYALGRGRAAAVATIGGWVVAVLAAVVAVGVLAAGAGDDGRAAVVGIGAGNTAGMLVAGVLLLAAVRRAGGPAALDGVARAVLVAALAAVAGSSAGRPVSWLAGDSITGAVAAGAGAGVVAAVVFAVVVAVADRRDAAALAGRVRPLEACVRVLQVLATSAGGVGRHVRDLASGLAAEGVGVRVAGPAATDAAFGFGAAGLPFAGVEISDRPRPLADLRASVRLRRLAGEADVVHAHGLRAGALAVLAARSRRRGPAVVVTLHNALVSGGRTAVVHRALERVVARADLVLGVSADLVEGMRRRGARRTGLAIVPAPELPAATNDRDAVRAALGVPGGASLLVTVARLAPQKGLDVLAAALERLRAEHPELAWHAVVADGPLLESLRGGPLHLLGHRDDVADLFGAADVVVVPSLWEGQSLALREALRAGAAIVATDAGGNRAVAGDAAAYARPGESGDLADRLAEVLSGPATAEVLRRNARLRAGSLPTAPEAVHQVMTCYDAAATRPRHLPRPPA